MPAVASLRIMVMVAAVAMARHDPVALSRSRPATSKQVQQRGSATESLLVRSRTKPATSSATSRLAQPSACHDALIGNRSCVSHRADVGAAIAGDSRTSCVDLREVRFLDRLGVSGAY
jgi:hypothetical protein